MMESSPDFGALLSRAQTHAWVQWAKANPYAAQLPALEAKVRAAADRVSELDAELARATRLAQSVTDAQQADEDRLAIEWREQVVRKNRPAWWAWWRKESPAGSAAPVARAVEMIQADLQAACEVHAAAVAELAQLQLQADRLTAIRL